MLSAAELLSMQQDTVAAACDQTCVISRASQTRDTMGTQSTSAYNVIATTVAGIAQPTGAQLANYNNLVGAMVSWQVKLPVGTDVQRLDQLTIAGQKMIVQVLLNPNSYSALLTVLATEIKG